MKVLATAFLLALLMAAVPPARAQNFAPQYSAGSSRADRERLERRQRMTPQDKPEPREPLQRWHDSPTDPQAEP